MKDSPQKQSALKLRRGGKTYDEISLILDVPKSTLSFWLRDVPLSTKAEQRLTIRRKAHNENVRQLANASKQKKKTARLESLRQKNEPLAERLRDHPTAKIALAALYLGEGTKNRSSVTFGNSNPKIIRLFLKLFRQCYDLDEKKFRCTVQCRADQNTNALETFWSEATQIPLSKFYKSRIDQRTVGKPSKKPNYQGVCRIDYLSADVFNDVSAAIDAITTGR